MQSAAKRKNHGPTLQPFVETLKTGDPIGHANLTLVPLRGEGRGQLDYILAVETLASRVIVKAFSWTSKIRAMVNCSCHPCTRSHKQE